jgi:hypothetical protein
VREIAVASNEELHAAPLSAKRLLGATSGWHLQERPHQQMRMQAAERVFVLGVAGLTRRLDRHVRVLGERQQFRLEAIGTVAVRLSREGDSALLGVTDQGPGIPAEELEVIFQPFRQGHLGTAKEGKSAGLGLAIANSIARGHGGRLWAGSMPPNGGIAGGRGSCAGNFCRPATRRRGMSCLEFSEGKRCSFHCVTWGVSSRYA